MSFIGFFIRDFKSDKSFNWFYILCASLGIIGLLLVESFKGGIEDKVTKNAKNFIASDLSVSTRRTLDPSETTKLETYLQNNKLPFSRWTETYSLVSKTNESEPLAKLSDLNFVSEEFPYYGGVTLEESGYKGVGSWQSLHQNPLVWIARDLSWQLGVKVGDKLKIGELNFKIDGIISEDNFSSFRGFSLAPKIFLSYNYLKQTELIKFGSTATYAYAIKLSPDLNLKKIQAELRLLLPDKSIHIVSPDESSKQIAKSLNILSDYLSLITLLTYLLSLVGLYYFTQYFLSKKLKTFSIYKTLGIKTSFLFHISFLHLFVLTLMAVVTSTILIIILLPFVETISTHLIGDNIHFKLGIWSLLRILLLSLFGNMLALGPLFWGALQTSIGNVFQDLPTELKRIKFYYFLPLVAYVNILTILLSNSVRTGSYFLFTLIIIVIVAALCFKGFTKLFEQLAVKFNFINRHASFTLSRYFTSTFTIFICLLISMTFSVFIFQLDHSLRQEFTQTSGNRRPDLFMFDLQDSQAKRFSQLVYDEKWHQTLLAPMIRARLIKINQELTQKKTEQVESDFSTRDEQNSERMKNRGVNLSYRSQLSWSEKVVAGAFNGKNCDTNKSICEISLVDTYASQLGVKIGDHLTFDVGGVEVEGVVRSLRKVKWVSFEPNFFILFQPGILEDAPKTYLASFKVKSSMEKMAVFSKIADNFSNVSLLDTTEVIKKITTIFDLMAMAIKFISILSLMVALVVIAAVSFNHLDLRKREMTLFHMLGLKKNIIKKIYTREFLFLILLSTLLSLFFGSVMTLVLMKYVFNSESITQIFQISTLMTGIATVLYLMVNLRVNFLLKEKSLF